MPLRQLRARVARRLAEQVLQLIGVNRPELRLAVFPGHVHALAEMAEVAEIQLESAIGLGRDHLPQLVGLRWLAIGRESHHLVFIAVFGEAEVLRDRGVKQAQRMRIMNALKNIDRIATADGEHRRDKIAKAIDGQAHSFFIRRAEKRRGDVSQVMLDGIERRELFPGII